MAQQEQKDQRAPAARILVIDRSRWLRGEGGNSRLLREADGKMCCLGFMALACGYEPAHISNEAEPAEMYHGGLNANLWPEWLAKPCETDFGNKYLRSTATTTILIATNDAPTLPDGAREAEIAGIFAEHGVEVRFVDGNAPEGRPQVIPPSRGTP